jgi:uncharacterized protein YkvS
MLRTKIVKDGIIFQVEMRLNEELVLVDITYSGGENDELEFEYAQVSEENSFDYEKEQTLNKVLENGAVEDLVKTLMDHYQKEGVINFVPGEYQF